jgi:hypothetical protein
MLDDLEELDGLEELAEDEVDGPEPALLEAEADPEDAEVEDALDAVDDREALGDELEQESEEVDLESLDDLDGDDAAPEVTLDAAPAFAAPSARPVPVSSATALRTSRSDAPTTRTEPSTTEAPPSAGGPVRFTRPLPPGYRRPSGPPPAHPGRPPR